MVKRRVEWKTYLIIGIITFAFFFSGIFTGIFMSIKKIDILSEQVDQFRTSIRETETMMQEIRKLPQQKRYRKNTL